MDLCIWLKKIETVKYLKEETGLGEQALYFTLLNLTGLLEFSSYTYQIGGWIYWSAAQKQGSAKGCLRGKVLDAIERQ